jgi:hypothetical protein
MLEMTERELPVSEAMEHFSSLGDYLRKHDDRQFFDGLLQPD